MELSEEKSQSLHLQKSPQWAEQLYFKKEKNRFFEWYKKLVYAGPKSARNILTNLSPNPDRNRARPEKASPTAWRTSATGQYRTIRYRNWRILQGFRKTTVFKHARPKCENIETERGPAK